MGQYIIGEGLYDIGVDILRLLNLDVLGRIKTEIITVNSNKIVSYPQDYINYIKAGVPNRQGEIATFTINNDLSLYNTSGNRSVSDESSSIDNSYLSSDYRNYNCDGLSYKIFGLGSDANIGSFREDNENRCFAF
jgi:hypothetical protein